MTSSSPVRESKKARKPKNPEHIKPLVEAEMERLLKLEDLKFPQVEETIYPWIVDA